jgi:hypothetical protein
MPARDRLAQQRADAHAHREHHQQQRRHMRVAMQHALGEGWEVGQEHRAEEPHPADAQQRAEDHGVLPRQHQVAPGLGERGPVDLQAGDSGRAVGSAARPALPSGPASPRQPRLLQLVGQLAAGGREQHERQDEQRADHQAGHALGQPGHLQLVGDQHGEGELEQVVIAGAQELHPEERAEAALAQQGELVRMGVGVAFVLARVSAPPPPARPGRRAAAS